MRIAVISLAVVSLCGAAGSAPKLPAIKFTDTKLENGLRVVIAEDHDAPVYSIAVSYNVGSRNERAGRTGFAHLFEHMMFKGSEKVGPGEHFYLVFNNGGNMNGTTNNDRTLYFETLPANQLDLGLFLESDRMRSLAISKDNLDNQRNAVQEERRMRVDNQPYGLAFEKVDELAYDNFAYKHSVIGSMEDLTAASVDDVREFFRIYYAPNNAVLAIVGDVDTKATLAKIKKYFGDIPKQSAPPAVDLSEKPRSEERREVLHDKLARLPMVLIAYRVGNGNDKSTVALSVLHQALAGGESSRLYQKLVKEKELVTSINAQFDVRIGPSLYAIWAMVRPGKDPKEVESAITEEIARVSAEALSDNELLRARSSLRRGAVQRQGSSLDRARILADDAVMYNNPNRINTLLDSQTAISAEDVQRTAREYLKVANRVVITTLPAAPPAPAKAKAE